MDTNEPNIGRAISALRTNPVDQMAAGDMSTRAVAMVLGCSASTVARHRTGNADVCGSDGKRYPRYRPAGERELLAGYVHAMRHDDGLSVRAIQQRLAANDIRRSVGAIANMLNQMRCADCP